MTCSHGHAKRGQWTPTYKAWRGMRDRVKRDPDYSHVTICSSWDSYQKFLADMGEKPLGKTLDRINNSAGYSKSNCRWASVKEQARNKTSNALFSFAGKKLPLAQIAEITGIPYKTLFSRIRQRGWEPSRAFATEVLTSRRNRNATTWRDKNDL